MTEEDQLALRECVEICWRRRSDLGLRPEQIDRVLIAWMSIGRSDEAEAAAELLFARREAERHQSKFEALLG